MFAEKPNSATAFTSDQFLTLAKQVERAQTLGSISEEKGDSYIDMLIRANDLLTETTEFYGDIEACTDSTTKFQCIDDILATVEKGIQNE